MSPTASEPSPPSQKFKNNPVHKEEKENGHSPRKITKFW